MGRNQNNRSAGNRQVRVRINVGVAYGSDIPLVMKTLEECSATVDKICPVPAPQILFINFGESSLDFQLRVSVIDADNRLEVQSALHQIIDQRFRENGIVIAFPQMDLHINPVPDEKNSSSGALTGEVPLDSRKKPTVQVNICFAICICERNALFLTDSTFNGILLTVLTNLERQSRPFVH